MITASWKHSLEGSKMKCIMDNEKEYKLYDEFAETVKEYIDYYNNERIQTKIKWMPPAKYRETSMLYT